MAKRRRFTYEAAAKDGRLKTGLYLAYSAEGIERYLASRGYTNISVEPAKRAIRGAGQPAAWTLDKRALAHACRALGVTWPVEIRRTAAKGRSGRHLMTRADYGVRHRITVDKLISPGEAARTIIHELTHAAQTEAAGSWEAWKNRCLAERRIPYRYRPIEVEARANAESIAIVCASHA